MVFIFLSSDRFKTYVGPSLFTEQGKTELDPPAESTKVYAKPGELVERSEIEPTPSTKNLEDHETEKESNSEENLSGRTHDVENQNPMKKG